MGILIHPAFCRGNPYFSQHIDGYFSCFCLTQVLMTSKHLDHMIPDLFQRVQGSHRILEDHCHIFSTHFPFFFFGHGQQILLQQFQMICLHICILSEKPHDRLHGYTFPTSGLSYNSQNISFIHMEGDTAHRLDLLFVTLKRGGQIVYG